MVHHCGSCAGEGEGRSVNCMQVQGARAPLQGPANFPCGSGVDIRNRFYTEDPDGVGYIVKIFMFTELSLSTISEVTLFTHRYYKALYIHMLTTYDDTAALLQ